LKNSNSFWLKICQRPHCSVLNFALSSLSIKMSQGEEAVLISCSGTFTEAAIRRGFVWKAYGILTAQLVVTMAIVGFFYIPTVVDYAISNNCLFWVNFAITFTCLISLALKSLFSDCVHYGIRISSWLRSRNVREGWC